MCACVWEGVYIYIRIQYMVGCENIYIYAERGREKERERKRGRQCMCVCVCSKCALTGGAYPYKNIGMHVCQET